MATPLSGKDISEFCWCQCGRGDGIVQAEKSMLKKKSLPETQSIPITITY